MIWRKFIRQAVLFRVWRNSKKRLLKLEMIFSMIKVNESSLKVTCLELDCLLFLKTISWYYLVMLYPMLQRIICPKSDNTNLRGSIPVWLTSCLFYLDSSACFCWIIISLLVWSNPNQSNRRSVVQRYLFSAQTNHKPRN